MMKTEKQVLENLKKGLLGVSKDISLQLHAKLLLNSAYGKFSVKSKKKNNSRELI